LIVDSEQFIILIIIVIIFTHYHLMTDQQPKTQFSQMVTQAVQNVQRFGTVALKPNARPPQLYIEGESKPFKLIGDRYLLGRSSKSSDIVVRNEVVSQVHLSLEKDPKNPRHFLLEDKNSTNGIYQGKSKIKSLSLRHGDKITLGPPDLKNAVEIKYDNPPPWWVYLIQWFLYGSGGIFSLIVILLGIEWTKISVYPLPKGLVGPTVIYDNTGQIPLRKQQNRPHRELKNLSDFSPYLPKAVIASEDSRYYWHFGVDPYGILRAVIINFTRDDIKQGASTVTQQLARSLFTEVGRENTAGRKLREMIVALKLEAVYSKDVILKTYLNRVYLGVGNNGFEDAAQFYFNKSATNLDIAEAATLVAILPAPNAYNPVQDYDTALQLRNRVIMRMVQLGFITEEEGNRARRSRITIGSEATESFANITAPYFYSYIYQELKQILGEDLAKEGNFIVESTINLDTQKKSETALKDMVNNYGNSYRFSQGAVVTLDSKNGSILALNGGVDYNKSQFNRATQAKRQPGSTFKVFAYAAALESGISPYKYYTCAGLFWQGQQYKPCERSGGDINMFQALAQSENSVSLRIAKDVGLNKVIELAQKLGIKSQLKSTPGLILGESEVSVLEITGAYATFANRGVWNRPHGINIIRDGGDCTDYQKRETCRIIYSFSEDKNNSKKAISDLVANSMTAMLQGVVTSGTGKAAYLGLGEAGKTGTTNRYVDLWYIGYIPNKNLVTGIWLGNDDNSPTSGSSGQAAALWAKYMKQLTINN
jgi:1A family penicillin-binding protein